jgi:hypothetical protein
MPYSHSKLPREALSRRSVQLKRDTNLVVPLDVQIFAIGHSGAGKTH